MPDAYLFDMDGTLIDTEVLWVEATALFFKDYGLDVPPERTRSIVYGRAWPDVHATIVAEHPPVAHLALQEMDAAMRPHFERMRNERDVRIEPSIALLRRLAEHRPVTIVSGSHRADVAHGIEMMGLGELIPFFLGAEDYSPGKPHPACYLNAAERLAVAPEACVVFEDSAAGVSAAKAAGMYCVALQRENSAHEDVSAADRVLSDLSAFEDHLPAL